jgi:murein L,D-transpeptidase YcbB/YkuD
MTGDLAEALDNLRPTHNFYKNLKIALAKYRGIQAGGGWNPVPTGETLKIGMTSDRVPALRMRLSSSGDLQEAPMEPNLFDERLEKAVKHFQRRHRLVADGVVGKNTLEALNVPVEKRIEQIRVNLDHARWVLHAIVGKFVLVDIAGVSGKRQFIALAFMCSLSWRNTFDPLAQVPIGLWQDVTDNNMDSSMRGVSDSRLSYCEQPWR